MCNNASVLSLGEATVIFTDARAFPNGTTPQHFATLLAQLLGRPIPVLVPEQRHTAIVFTFSGSPPAPGPHSVGVCDAIMTPEFGVALAVKTADCLPIALAAPGTVAIIHAGWRGLAQGLVQKTVSLLGVQFGVKAETVEAAVGVGIGPCHYPVGDDVLVALRQSLGGKDGFYFGNRVDLGSFARLALLEAGVKPKAIQLLEGCTACNPHYHSYRRDGQSAGRQWAAVALLGHAR